LDENALYAEFAEALRKLPEEGLDEYSVGLFRDETK